MSQAALLFRKVRPALCLNLLKVQLFKQPPSGFPSKGAKARLLQHVLPSPECGSHVWSQFGKGPVFRETHAAPGFSFFLVWSEILNFP